MAEVPRYVWEILGFTALNVVINLTVKAVLRSKQFSKYHQQRVPLYVISGLNAALSSSYGLWHFASGASSAPADIQRLRSRICLAYVTGYFAQDLLFIIPLWKEYRLDIFHHLLGISLGVMVSAANDQIYADIPYFALQELSTIPLNLMWLSKQFPSTFGQVVPQQANKMLFALLFFVTRVIIWPARFAVRFQDYHPVLALLLAVFTALQLYWFVFIVKKAIGKG